MKMKFQQKLIHMLMRIQNADTRTNTKTVWI